jgi:hypothetical protein
MSPLLQNYQLSEMGCGRRKVALLDEMASGWDFLLHHAIVSSRLKRMRRPRAITRRMTQVSVEMREGR